MIIARRLASRCTKCLAVGFALLLMSACGSIGNATLPASKPSSVSVTPAIARVRAGDKQQFSATILTRVPGALPKSVGNASPDLVWSVNGIPGGDSTVGFIDSNGLYKAPDTLPAPALNIAIGAAWHSASGNAVITIENPIPIVTSVTPTAVSAGSFQLTVSGRGFAEGARILFGGSALETTFISSARLAATASATSARLGDIPISVTNPDPGSAVSTGGFHVQVTASTPETAIAISPLRAVLQSGSRQQFTTTMKGTTNPGVRWLANGVPGGNPALGTISPTGLYTAPHTPPPSGSVAITAISLADNSRSATAAVQVVSQPAQDGASVCGPPKYLCARTDPNASGHAATLPNWGGLAGANTVFTDAGFNPGHPVQYVRVTDASTVAAHPNFDFTVPTGGSGDENTFNADDTLFTVGDQGGNTYFFRLDPTSMATGLV
jgi:hypothetical protein